MTSSAEPPGTPQSTADAGDPGRRRSSRSSRGNGHASGFVAGLWAFVRELVISVVLALVISFVVKTWLLQSFHIPSGSMQNTLVPGDRVVVSKLTPGVFDVNRGDIVVFEDPDDWLRDAPRPEPATGLARVLIWIGVLPEDEGNHLIKRVIGLPGDRVRCCTADGHLLVNDTPIDEPYLFPGAPPSSLTFDITVPAGRIWVMGDNRDHSEDSRYNDAPAHNGLNGSVPISNVVGRAFAVIWPLSRAGWLNDSGDTFAGVPAPASASGVVTRSGVRGLPAAATP